MILFTLIVRRFFLNHLPHTVFSFLWIVIALRLLCPFYVETPYSYLNWQLPIEEKLIQASLLQPEILYTNIIRNLEDIVVQNEQLILCCWLIGFTIVGLYFVILYICMFNDIILAKPLSNRDWIKAYIREQKIYRSIKLKQKSNLDSPAVWGIWNSIILFPETYDFTDKEQILYVILHECGHIKFYHSLCKIMSIILVSVYWYNPFVWTLYLYLE